MPNVLRPFWRLIVLFCKFYGIFAFHSAKIYVTRPPSISEKKIAGSNFSCTFMHSTLKSRNKLQKKCTYNSRVWFTQPLLCLAMQLKGNLLSCFQMVSSIICGCMPIALQKFALFQKPFSKSSFPNALQI